MTNPWRKILGIGVITFFIVLTITYSYCQGNSSCVSPLQPNLSTASTDQLQSAVTKFKRKVKKKKSILPPGPSYADPALAPSSMMPQMPPLEMPMPTPEAPTVVEQSVVAAPSMPVPPPPIAEFQPPPPPSMMDVPPPMAPTIPDPAISTSMPQAADSGAAVGRVDTPPTTMPSYDPSMLMPTPPTMPDSTTMPSYDPSSIMPPPSAPPTVPSMDTTSFATPGPSMMTTASIPDMYSYCDFESAHMDARDGAYLDKLTSQFLDQLPNIKVTGGTNRYDNFVNPCHLRFLAMGLAPFQEMLKTIKTKVIISRESLGPGYRAFTSIDGDTVVIIAPTSYSRPMTPQEFLNLIRHEFGHVLHILWLNDAKRSEWDSLIHTGATNEQGVLSLSEYGATRGEPGKDPHVYEALAEDLLSLLLFGRDTIESRRPEFLPVYDFLNSSFSLERFGSRRYQGSVDYDSIFPSGRDATRLIKYPLPEMTP